jgi:hypothetical protein
MYHAKKMSFLLSTLNSDDEQTRHTARTSLTLHLDKRKCRPATLDNEDNNFAGYATDDGYRLIKTSKVNWRKSPWIHLNELCAKLGVRLRCNADHQFVLSYIVDEDVLLSFTDPASFYTSFKCSQIQKIVGLWKEKESQGRLTRASNIDRSVSSAHLVNLKLGDSLVKFVVRARLQLLECNTLLHTYYPASYEKRCIRCGFHTDTVSHVLNGCRCIKNAIQKRHNRVAAIVSGALKEANQRATILSDVPLRPSQFVEDSTDVFALRHTRPDVCLINHTDKTCLLAEIAVPFDSFLDTCYTNKFNRYIPLCQHIQDLGFQCKVFVFIVGSLGNVHSKFISGLKLCGIMKRQAKAIAKFCSISAMIGSKIIWKQRCKNIL